MFTDPGPKRFLRSLSDISFSMKEKVLLAEILIGKFQVNILRIIIHWKAKQWKWSHHWRKTSMLIYGLTDMYYLIYEVSSHLIKNIPEKQSKDRRGVYVCVCSFFTYFLSVSSNEAACFIMAGTISD